MGFSASTLASLGALYSSPGLMQEWKRAQVLLIDKYTCWHEETETRWQIQGANGKRYRPQCLRCGILFPILSKDLVLHPEKCKPIEPAIKTEFQDRKTADERALHQKYRELAQSANIVLEYQIEVEYAAYINGAEWSRKRALVLERDNNLCQGCLRAKAAQVHHLTYVHLGCELLYELVSLCQKCHEFAHAVRTYAEWNEPVIETVEELPF